MGKNKVYAVAKGRKPGIYHDWKSCQEQIKGYPNAKFKSFSITTEAQHFITANGGDVQPNHTSGSTNRPNNYTMPTDSCVVAGGTRKQKVYAVANGKKPGIYKTWKECQAQTKGFSRALFKSFTCHEEAQKFIIQYTSMNDTNINAGTKRKLAEESHSSSNVTNKRSQLHINYDSSIHIQIWFDGGSRGNPGIAGAGAYVITTATYQTKPSKYSGEGDGNHTRKRMAKIRKYCGNSFTNNHAEYTGLIEGLKQAKASIDEFFDGKVGATAPTKVSVDIKGDSNLVINQVSGAFSCGKDSPLKGLNAECIKLTNTIKGMDNSQVRNSSSSNSSNTSYNNCTVDMTMLHVYRDSNAIADGLANEAMDQRKSWTTYEDDVAIEIEV